MLNTDSLKVYAQEGLNLILTGKHGVGKTAVIKKVFNETFGEINKSWKYFSASTLDPWVDFIGIPKDYQNGDGDTVFKIIPPDSFTGKEKIEAIFFDEINRADEKTLNAIMELIQFRSINGRPFPHLKCIWAAENPADDDDNDYSVRVLDPAQKDRFQIQLKVPYELDREYMVGKYGETLFNISSEWWEGAKGERKKIISPRKLDDMLFGFTRGHDINDYTNSISVDELKSSLESVGKFEQYKIIAASNDPENIKRFFTIEKIRSAENLFPSLDPKNIIFNNIYPHLADEIKKYVENKFKYDYNDRNRVILSDAQLAHITSISAVLSKPEFTFVNAKAIREGIAALNKHFSYKDVLTNPILDASDLKMIAPFNFDVEKYLDDGSKRDLASAIASPSVDADRKNFENFYKFALASCVTIGRTKGVEYMKETAYYKFCENVSKADANRVYSISVTSQYQLLNKLNEGNFSEIKEEDFKNENLFFNNNN